MAGPRHPGTPRRPHRPGGPPSPVGRGAGPPLPTLPLPAATALALQQAGGVSGCDNLSLALNRLVSTWQAGFAGHDDVKRRAFFEACCKIPARQAAQDVLRFYRARYQTLLGVYSRVPWQQCSLRARLRTRLVCGLGIANPLEVNLALHRAGFPYLPGSSIKGAVRTLAEAAENEEEAVRVIFGPRAEDVQAKRAVAAQGAVVFFDALPIRFTLDLDIVNPHHTEYYTGGAFPADWQSPVPVPFLSVAPGAEFRFALASRQRLQPSGALEPLEQVAGRLDRTRAWLRQALEAGLGGKTSAGYGRFEVIG